MSSAANLEVTLIDPPSEDGFDQRTWTVALLSITLIAAFLRIFAIDFQSIWYDESYTANIIRSSYESLARGITRDNGNPPLYWLLAKAWSDCFGDSSLALRSLPTIFGILTVPLLGILGRKLAGSKPGLLAAGLLAVSPMAIELSNEARAYGLMGLLAVASTLCLVTWLEGKKSIYLISYSIFLALSWYCHYFCGILLIAHVLYVLGLKRELHRDIRFVGAICLAGLLFLPWLPVFVQQVKNRDVGGGTGAEGVKMQLMGTPLVFGFGRTLAWKESGTLKLLLATAASLIFVWGPTAFGAVRLSKRVGLLILLTTWGLAPFFAPALTAIFSLPTVYYSRYAYVGIPAFYLLTAIGICHAPPRTRVLILVVILVLTAVSDYRYAAVIYKDDWRSASQRIFGSIQPDEIVATDPEFEVAPFKYFSTRPGGQLPVSLIGIMEASPATGVIQGIERVGRDSTNPPKLEDKSAEIIASPGVWLVIRGSNTPTEEYIRFFERNGFKLDVKEEFARLELLHFVKSEPTKPN